MTGGDRGAIGEQASRRNRAQETYGDLREHVPRGEGPMVMMHNAMNADDLSQSIEHLSDEIGRMRRAGPLSFQDVQKAVSSLTRAQLVLNELERVEIRERGVGLYMAERFAVLDSRLRAIRYDLYKDLTSRNPAGAEENGGEAHHIAGRR